MGMRPIGLLRTELTLQRRHGVLTGTAVGGALWVLLLLAVPGGWRPSLVPWLLLLEVTSIGFFVVPALSVVERSNGVTAALRLTRLRPGAGLTVRIGWLVVWAVATAAVVVVVSGIGWSVTVLSGVALTTVLFALVAVLMVGRSDTLTPFIGRAAIVGGPLLAPAIFHGSGLLETPALFVSPATGAFAMLLGDAPPLAVGWVLLCLVTLWVFAVRIGFDVRPTAPPRRTSRRVQIVQGRGGTWTAVRSYAQVDRRTLASDHLLLLLLGGIPAIAIALRVFAGPGVGWVDARYGLDLTPYFPAISAFILAIHVPVIVGSLVGLLFLEDRDAGLLPSLSTTPAGIRTVVAYRLAAGTLAATIAVVLAILISGTTHPAGSAGIAATALAGGAVAGVPAVLLGAFGRDRAQGMALVKMMTVPLYAPAAWWLVDGPIGWLFAPIPTAWAAQALWAPTPGQAILSAAACVTLSLGVIRLLGPRLLRTDRAAAISRSARREAAPPTDGAVQGAAHEDLRASV